MKNFALIFLLLFCAQLQAQLQTKIPIKKFTVSGILISETVFSTICETDSSAIVLEFDQLEIPRESELKKRIAVIIPCNDKLANNFFEKGKYYGFKAVEEENFESAGSYKILNEKILKKYKRYKKLWAINMEDISKLDGIVIDR